MPPRPLAVVTDFLGESSVEAPILEPVADLRLLQTPDEMEVVRLASQAAALLVYHEMNLTQRSLSKLSTCRVIVRCGVGVDNIDLQAAGRLGIVVCNVPDYGSEEVADHAILLLLAATRRLVVMHNAVVRGIWDPSLIYGTPRLRGRTVGVIGCGRIGTAFALRARVLGLRVLIYDPYQPAGLEKALGVERSHRLEELLPQCDFLSLHCPLTEETQHMLNERTLGLLPAGAVVVNTARGGCVDLAALAAALDSGRVAGAGLDVVEREPLDDDRIRRHPNVVLTPHAAFYSVEGYREIRVKSAEEVRRALGGEPVRNAVNLNYLESPRCLVPKVKR
jgi:C-terminal binding protein